MAEATLKSQSLAPKLEPEIAARVSPVRRALDAMAVPILAVFTALVISGFIIAFSDRAVLGLLPTALQNPLGFLGAMWSAVTLAYGALLTGAFGQPDLLAAGIQSLISTGDNSTLLKAIYPLSETLVAATPYIFAGLSVAVGFRAGLFNIGAEGQLFMGALASAFVGYSITGLPWFIHLPLTLAAGALAGAIWGMIPAYLKAKTGAHEVINTIMMNYIAFALTDFLLTGPMMVAHGGNPRTPEVEPSAYLPAFFPPPLRVHWGIVLALGVAAFIYWFLFKTTLGFELRTVGSSPRAAKYAGINITRSFLLAMGIAGALAGVAGAGELLGVNHYLANSFSPGYGYDSIALALLGKSHPLGVVLAALLFGFLRSGATHMQSIASVPVDIISIMQALIIAFIAAPGIVRWLYRLRAARAGEREVFTRGWGG
jgi:simple sugar transport system permease protein